MDGKGRASSSDTPSADNPMAVRPPHFAPKAKRVIYLHMSGGPPQQELFDYKPKLVKHNMQPCPDSLLKNSGSPSSRGIPKLLGTPYKFAQHGQCGAWVSELLPHFSEMVDDVAFIKSMQTDQFNHAPAELFLFTGSPAQRRRVDGLVGDLRARLGERRTCPASSCSISGGTDPTGGKALWSTGFLPTVYQGVQCRTVGRPGPLRQQPEGDGPRRPPPHARRPPPAQRVRAASSSATPRPSPASASTSWPSACRWPSPT